jgi:hypothetical protein
MPAQKKQDRPRSRWVLATATMVAAIALWMYNATPVGHHELVLAGWASAPVAADGALASAAAAACGAGGGEDTPFPNNSQDQRGDGATRQIARGGQK